MPYTYSSSHPARTKNLSMQAIQVLSPGICPTRFQLLYHQLSSFLRGCQNHSLQFAFYTVQRQSQVFVILRDDQSGILSPFLSRSIRLVIYANEPSLNRIREWGTVVIRASSTRCMVRSSFSGSHGYCSVCGLRI